MFDADESTMRKRSSNMNTVNRYAARMMGNDDSPVDVAFLSVGYSVYVTQDSPRYKLDYSYPMRVNGQTVDLEFLGRTDETKAIFAKQRSVRTFVTYEDPFGRLLYSNAVDDPSKYTVGTLISWRVADRRPGATTHPVVNMLRQKGRLKYTSENEEIIPESVSLEVAGKNGNKVYLYVNDVDVDQIRLNHLSLKRPFFLRKVKLIFGLNVKQMGSIKYEDPNRPLWGYLSKNPGRYTIGERFPYKVKDTTSETTADPVVNILRESDGLGHIWSGRYIYSDRVQVEVIPKTVQLEVKRKDGNMIYFSIYQVGFAYQFSTEAEEGFYYKSFEEMTSEENRVLHGFLEAAGNRLFLRTLSLYKKTREEREEIIQLQQEITDDNDVYFASLAKEGVGVLDAPKKAKRQSKYGFDGPRDTLRSPSYRPKPRPGTGPDRGTINQLMDQYGRMALDSRRNLADELEAARDSRRTPQAPRGRSLLRPQRLSPLLPISRRATRRATLSPISRRRGPSIAEMARKIGGSQPSPRLPRKLRL